MTNVRDQKIPSLPLLWFGVLTPPVAWTAHLSVEYFLVTLQCQLGTDWAESLMHVATPALLALVLAGGASSLHALRRSDRAMAEPAAIERSRFMASSGLILAALFTLMIAFGALPIYLLDHCATGR